jgi:hypothetical protein
MYCDDVLLLPPIAAWLKSFHDDGCSGLNADFSPEMRAQVQQFYFKRCLHHFHSPRNQSYALALSSIPFVYAWDDHDIFDGFGSYDDDIQVCGPWWRVSVCVLKPLSLKCVFKLTITVILGLQGHAGHI